MDPKDAIRDYFRAFKNKDRAMLERVLAQDLVHSSPFGVFNDRDAMLDQIWPSVGAVWAVDLEIFGEAPKFMVRYKHSDGSPAQFAEYFHFKGDQIAGIEVYLGRGCPGFA